ncbi:glycoside hydrolase family 3 N-terminal domain-containing protein, partial [uncultured Rikenella sp.]|uniref:glycoside hydrolase family 3 N-terminal domain-containing protein n=1 Tax=uncultured Rikenella sp. TaxID=368003 RepID=UPI002634BFB3
FRATNFPTQLGVGHTWNRSLVYKMGEIEGREARALGYTHIYAPILDVGRDQRWGRYEEVYGESPYLVAELGIQMVRGIQSQGVAATAKHFVGYSNGKGAREGMARNNPQMSLREMEQIHVYPFGRVIREAGLLGIMSSYNDFDGEPIQGSYHWLTEVLRGRYGFRGYVVSDSDAVEYLYSKHFTAADMKEAVRQAVEAGLNVRCTFRSPDSFIVPLRELVQEGALSEEVINDRVRDILRVKFLCGLFDRPYRTDLAASDAEVCSEANEAVAKQISLESIVLLKNEANTLPLSRDSVRRVAVIGPNAAATDFVTARYGPNAVEPVSVLDGIRGAVAANGVEVVYAKGCELVDDNWPDSELMDYPLTQAERDSIEAAYAVAAEADAVVLVLGGGTRTCGENKSRSSLDLPGRQQQLLERITPLRELGKRVVLVLINGRPLSVNWADRYVPAIVEAWYPGRQGGVAVAEVLFGDYNPGGKLTVTFPRSVGQIPFNFPTLPSAQSDSWGANGPRSHRARVNGALYPFGYGLSYTTFGYSDLQLSDTVVTPHRGLTVACTVTNTGTREGDEVVQLYLHDKVASVMAYEKVLRGFERVHLLPGEGKRVEFELHPRDLEILDIHYKWRVEPGDFTVMVGASSEDIRLQRDFTVVEAGRLLEMRASERKGALAAKVSASIHNDRAVCTVDGDPNTVWEGARNQYITYELRSGAKPTSLGIAWEEGDPVEFEIQLSSGGGLFVPVWRGRSRLNNGTMETYTFDGATSSDLRIVILGDKARIKEVKLNEL